MLKEKAEKAEEKLKEHTKLLELKNKELDMIANGAEDELRLLIVCVMFPFTTSSCNSLLYI